MTKEILSPNVKNSQLCGRRFRHSDFVIPSDFVIRHSDLRIAVCSNKRPVSGLVRAAGAGWVHGEPPFVFSACIGTMNRSGGTQLVWSPAFRRSGPAKAGTPNGRFMLIDTVSWIAASDCRRHLRVSYPF